MNPSIYNVGDYYDISITPSGGWRYDGGDGTITFGFRDGRIIVVDQNGTVIYSG